MKQDRRSTEELKEIVDEKMEEVGHHYGRPGHVSTREEWTRERFDEWVYLLAVDQHIEKRIASFKRRTRTLTKDLKSLARLLDDNNIRSANNISSASNRIDIESALFKLTAMRNGLTEVIEAMIEIGNRL